MAEKMAKAIDGFYPYFWHKFKLSPGNYAEEPQCAKWVQDLREAVLVHGIVSLWQWRPFLDKILLKNRFSFKTYTSYTFFIISTTVEDFPRHESFMTSCSLVTAIAAYVHDKGHHDFLEYCPDILMVIFEEKYLQKSDGIQIWEKLEDHLHKYKYSEAYKMVERTIEGNPFADEVYKLEFVTKIKEKIGSKIPVENPAVYCQIAKVEKRFRTRKSQKLQFIEDWKRRILVGEESTSVMKGARVAVLKSNSSSQKKDVEETEILRNNQSLSEEVKNDHNYSVQISSLQSEQTLQNDTNTLIMSGSEKGPVMYRIPVIISPRSSPFQMEPSYQNIEKPSIPEDERSLSVATENDCINSKQISSLQSEQTLQNDTNTLIEESIVVHSNPVITSNRNLPFQMKLSCQNVENSDVQENEQSLSVVKNDDIGSKQISLQSEETFRNDTNTLITSGSEESSEVHPIQVIISQRSSPFEMELSCQNVEVEIPENEKSLSVTEPDDIDSKKQMSLQLEQTLQNDTNTLIKADNEDSDADTLIISDSEEILEVHPVPVLTSKSSSPFQMEPSSQNVEAKISENVQSLSVAKDNDINSKKTSSLQSEQTPINDTDTLIKPDSEEMSVVCRIPVKTSNRNSPLKMESSWQNMEKPKLPENVRNLSVTEEHGDGEKQRSTFVSEQLLSNERRTLDNKKEPAVKSSVENLNSGDRSSQLETKIATEGNYSDVPHHLEATDQNMKRLLNDRKKLGTSDNKKKPAVKSSVKNLNSGDGSSQLETKIATEGNYSDVPHHLEATDQNMKRLLNERELLGTSENKRSTPVKSSVEKFNFGEESSLEEIELTTEGNYSDMPHGSEATDQNLKLLLNNREKLETSDNKEITSVQLSVDNLNSGLETENSDMPHESEATDQGIKRLLNGEELRILDNKQTIPVKFSAENLHSVDENSQLETGNTKEGNYSDIARDSETTDQDAAQQLQGKKKRNKKRKKSKSETETSEKNLSSSKMESSEDAGLKISSHSEKQSLQTIEKPMDTGENLPVPSVDDVLRACLFLEEKFKNSFNSVCDLLFIQISI